MKRILTSRCVTVLATVAFAGAAGGVSPAAVAPAGAATFTQPRSVIAAGGGRSSGGGFTVTGTVGQHDADPLQPSVGSAFAVTGGFWTKSAAAPVGGDIFSDGFEGPP